MAKENQIKSFQENEVKRNMDNSSALDPSKSLDKNPQA